MDDRRKKIEAFISQMKGGNPLTEDFLKPLPSDLNKWTTERAVTNRALNARNLAEDALAHEVLKNTGIPIPNDNAPRMKKEDFLNRLIKERYPEIDPDINMGLMLEDPTSPEGLYNVDSKTIHLQNKPNILKNASTSLHEAAHQYDDSVLKFDGTDDVTPFNKMKDSLPGKRALTDIDPTEAYELMAKGHHAEIPKLREGSFGLGALKSVLKSGTFKQMAGALPLAGTAAALASGDVSAAAEELPSEIPVVGQAYDAIRSESAGNSQDDKDIINEVQARKNYDNSPASNDLRQKALMALTKK